MPNENLKPIRLKINCYRNVRSISSLGKTHKLQTFSKFFGIACIKNTFILLLKVLAILQLYLKPSNLLSKT